jgi:hypothetical protein
MLEPSPNGRNGRGSRYLESGGRDAGVRDSGGRFAAGNSGGPGNPFARQAAQLRAALYEAVTADDIREIARALITQAKAGERWAIRELLDRIVGRPTVAVDVEVAEAVRKHGEIRIETEDELIAWGIKLDMIDHLPPGLRDRYDLMKAEGTLGTLPQVGFADEDDAA